MVRQVIIHTFCDPHYQDALETVDARTVTWFMQGQRMEVDVCVEHERTIALHQMDEFVMRYGRPWEDPDNPTKPISKSGSERRRRRKGVDPASHVLIDARYEPEVGYTCTVKSCPRQGEPITKIQGLRMHQLQAHGMRAPGSTTKKE